jgi:hypothetical protein
MNIEKSYNKIYLQQCKKYKFEPVAKKIFLAICGKFMLYLLARIFLGDEVNLPERLGKIYISGNKQKVKIKEGGKIEGVNVDWKKTKAFWESNLEAKEKKKLIYHTNEHSKGFVYKLRWNKLTAILPNKSMYKYSATRNINRELSRQIINEETEFLKE